MNERLLGQFLSFLEKEGLLTKPLSYAEIIDKFYSSSKTTAKITPPSKFKGFALGEKKKNTASE